MNPERYQQIARLYHAALEVESGERPAFLDRACAGDAELHREVESLIASDELAEDFIEAPALEVAAELLAQDQAESAVGRQMGHYQILSLLGAGGMGEVYLAEDTKLDRQVALKLLPAEFTRDEDRVRRFVQEAKAASALNHPHIVTIYEIGEAEAGRFIVMELVQGQTLRALPRPCPPDLLLNLGGQIARALAATHAAGIMHRDIKPDNIMLRPDGYVKVLDFGLARLAPAAATESEAATRLYQTTPGMVLGTAAYMSPEQARGETVTPASDIFALGIVFYELATGEHPFTAETALGFLHAINSQAPLSPARLNPAIPAALDALIWRMLEKDARRRPGAAEIAAALAESGRSSQPAIAPAYSLSHAPARPIVGREKERGELRSGFASALDGRGLLVGVAGEPGIGKTALVESFLNDLSASGQPCLIARGRCSERLAGTEGYLPWLEALGSLLRGGEASIRARGATDIARRMRQIAPTWYAQLAPFPIGDSSAAQLAAERAASQERMKRELAEFVQEISRAEPLLLFFEDLHWADASTIDLLAFLASRFAGLRVLIVATYRPSDLLLARHPFLRLKPELQSRGLCREIALGFLPRAEVDEYLALEFPGHRLPAELSALIYAKTEGNPLFMTDLARYLRDRGVIAEEQGRWTLAGSLPDLERDLPESVRGMIERKIAEISEDDRRLLIAASVQGYEFDSAVITKALASDAAQVEERLEALERIHGLALMTGEQEFPDHTLTLRYRFVHVLYQNALYAQLRPTRRAALSAAVAEALGGFYGEQRAAVASTLAVLHEAARDWLRAAEHFLIAARNALRGFANQEAIALARRGLAMLEKLPVTPEHARLEIRLQTTLGLSLMMVRGFAASEVLQTHLRARELCLQHGDHNQLFRAEFGLAIVHVVRAGYEPARELAEHCLQLAQGSQDTAMLVQAHWALGLSAQHLGELVSAREHFERTIALYDQKLHGPQYLIYGAILSRAHLGRLLLYLGFADASQELIREAISIAEKAGNPLGLCNTLSIASFVEALHSRTQRVREMAETILALSDEHGLPHYQATSQCLRGWALAMQGQAEEGVALLRAGLAAHRAAETGQQRSNYLAMLAEALGAGRRPAEALAALDEAVDEIDRTAEHFYEAELYRLKGELWLERGGEESDAPSNPQSRLPNPPSEAEQCFQQAIKIARRQSAKTFELRAATSLARLWRRQGRQIEARAALAEIHGSFTEGFDTADLKDARTLLEELSQ